MFAVLTHEDVPDVLYGDLGQGPQAVRAREGALRGRTSSPPSPRGRRRSPPQAAAAIEVEYEPLPAVSDIEAATAEGAPLIHEDWESYEVDEELGLKGNVLGFSTIVKGDADAAIEGADVVAS